MHRVRGGGAWGAGGAPGAGCMGCGGSVDRITVRPTPSDTRFNGQIALLAEALYDPLNPSFTHPRQARYPPYRRKTNTLIICVICQCKHHGNLIDICEV